MTTHTIAITAIEYDKGREIFESASNAQLCFISAPDDERGLAGKIREVGATGVILGISKYSKELYEALPEGAVIARFGVGHDGVDKQQTRAKGICVANTPGVLDVSVAEHAVGLMTALARECPAHTGEMRTGEYLPRRGVELRGKTLALIGFGRVAKEVASIAAKGFKMNIVACDVLPYADQATFVEKLAADAGVEVRYTNSMDEALSPGRFVSLHLPLMESTRRLINAKKLLLMRPEAFLINTARGGIVDESALYDALSLGRIAGAAFDVFANEPYVPVDPQKDLRTLKNFFTTPHIGSNTDASNRRMAETCVANIRAWAEGRTDDITLVS